MIARVEFHSTSKWFGEATPNATMDDLAFSFTTQVTQAIDRFS